MIQNSSIIISAGGFDRANKMPYANQFAGYPNPGAVLLIVLPKVNALVSCIAFGIQASIHSILRARAYSQIIPTIVKAVPIYVVYAISTVGKPKQNAVHFKPCLFLIGANSPCGIKILSALNYAPFPLIQKIKVCIINHCGKPARKWYLFHNPKKKNALKSAGLIVSHSRGGMPDAHAFQSVVLN